MPYGYLGQNLPNQTKSNSGVFSISDVADLEKQGKFGGSLELIEEQTHTSDVSTIDFTSIKENIYDVHLFVLSNIHSASGGQAMGMRFYESGVLETASVYQYARQIGTVTGTFSVGQELTRSDIPQMGTLDTTSGASGNQYIYCYYFGNSSKYSYVSYQDFTFDPNGGVFTFGGGLLDQKSTVDGVRFFLPSNTLNSFDIKLYGVKQI